MPVYRSAIVIASHVASIWPPGCSARVSPTVLAWHVVVDFGIFGADGAHPSIEEEGVLAAPCRSRLPHVEPQLKTPAVQKSGRSPVSLERLRKAARTRAMAA